MESEDPRPSPFGAYPYLSLSLKQGTEDVRWRTKKNDKKARWLPPTAKANRQAIGIVWWVFRNLLRCNFYQHGVLSRDDMSTLKKKGTICQPSQLHQTPTINLNSHNQIILLFRVQIWGSKNQVLTICNFEQIDNLVLRKRFQWLWKLKTLKQKILYVAWFKGQTTSYLHMLKYQQRSTWCGTWKFFLLYSNVWHGITQSISWCTH